jgi:FtsZ-binding cell division protein ZapB
MPSEHWDDHPWQKTTGINERRRILKQAEKANEQCRGWAIRLRALSGKLGDISHG